MNKDAMVIKASAAIDEIVQDFTEYLREHTIGNVTMEQLLADESQEAHDLSALLTITLVLQSVSDDLEGV